MSKSLLTATDICLSRQGQDLIKSVSVSVYQEQTAVLLGHNGAGKTLLLQILHGLISADSGRIEHQLSTEQKMVFQKPILLRRTALSHFQFATQSHDTALSNLWFKQAKLTDKKTVAARALSAGEQQKLALISALATKPSLLFLDEPTANLDQDSTKDIETLIKQAKADGTAIIMISHSLQQATRLADRILFMDHGSLLDDVTASDFFKGKQSAEAAQFIKER